MEEKATDSLKRLLVERFGHSQFRPVQRETIETVLSGRDVLAIMPTGGGKSLLYQLPALVPENGVALVISPLISLMKDQVDALTALGIPAAYSNSSQDELDQMRVLSHAVTGKIRLLYISPERAVSRSFLDVAVKMKVNLIAVDEAHCVSQWGHDFRPEYRKLSVLRKALAPQNPPAIALTATATERVMKDIADSLDLRSPGIFVQSFMRPNLSFRVIYPSSETEKEELLIRILRERSYEKNGSGRAIIYCATRKKVDEVFEFLKKNGFRAGKYHAGRSASTREKTHSGYQAGKHNILVATNAFGMGMDQPDVRLVLHYQIPSSLESYYQEAGRAGRDGNPSDCILFYRNADFVTQSFIIGREKNHKNGDTLLRNVREYGLTDQCRQVHLCRYFGEEADACGCCDLCEGKEHESRTGFISAETKKLKKLEELSSVIISGEDENTVNSFLLANPGEFGRRLIALTLTGSSSVEVKRKKLDTEPHYAALNHIPVESVLRHIDLALESGKMRTTGGKYPKVYLPERPPLTRAEKRAVNESLGIVKTPVKKKPSANQDLKKALTNFRDRTARRFKWKKYMVLQNAVIDRIALVKPATMRELTDIKGVGETKAVRFGEEILSIVAEFH